MRHRIRLATSLQAFLHFPHFQFKMYICRLSGLLLQAFTRCKAPLQFISLRWCNLTSAPGNSQRVPRMEKKVYHGLSSMHVSTERERERDLHESCTSKARIVGCRIRALVESALLNIRPSNSFDRTTCDTSNRNCSAIQYETIQIYWRQWVEYNSDDHTANMVALNSKMHCMNVRTVQPRSVNG